MRAHLELPGVLQGVGELCVESLRDLGELVLLPEAGNLLNDSGERLNGGDGDRELGGSRRFGGRRAGGAVLCSRDSHRRGRDDHGRCTKGDSTELTRDSRNLHGSLQLDTSGRT